MTTRTSSNPAVRRDVKNDLNIHPGDARDIERLREHGWRVTPPEVVATPESVRSYVRGSGAEVSAAQGIYVDTVSGWFSDRSVRYLASCYTGLSPELPVGHGLLAFRTVAEAAESVRSIVADYDSHAAAARTLADDHFDADRVLARFCEQVAIWYGRLTLLSQIVLFGRS